MGLYVSHLPISKIRISSEQTSDKAILIPLHDLPSPQPRLPDEQPLAATSISTCSASAVTVERAQRGGMGLDRILNTIDLDGSTKSDAIESSMKDLESLMAKAGEMVRLCFLFYAGLIRSLGNIDVKLIRGWASCLLALLLLFLVFSMLPSKPTL